MLSGCTGFSPSCGRVAMMALSLVFRVETLTLKLFFSVSTGAASSARAITGIMASAITINFLKILIVLMGLSTAKVALFH